MLDSLLISVLNMSLIASYVILFIIFARLLLKKTSKIFSYALWGIVLFKLICPFSFESAIGLLPSNTEPIPQDIGYQIQPQINTGVEIINNIINPALPIPNEGDSVNPLQIWTSIGSYIWLIGIIAMAIYSIIQLMKLKKKLIGSTPLSENIYLADHINSTFVIGLFKPKIYLPASLAENEQDFIITHEMHHIKRFDHVTRILAFIALTIHWFNPLVWLAFVLSGKDMEMSCDEAVMKKVNHDIRAEYSRSLLRFATGRKLISATPLAFGEGDTKGRVKNVMKYKKPMIRTVVALTVLIIVLMFIFGTNSIVATPEPMEGAASYFYVTKKDGNILTIGNVGNTYLQINNGFFEADYEWLQLFSKFYGYAPVPENFHYGKFETQDNQSSLLSQFYDIEIGTAKEPVREQFGEPNAYGYWGYVEIYLLEDAQIKIYYTSDSESNSFVEDVIINTHSTLSLNDVIMISQKGEDLAWSDFEDFPYIEGGSGVYIRSYEINDLFGFRIGGGLTDDAPLYMTLYTKNDPENGIDIRTEDVAEFISLHGNDIIVDNEMFVMTDDNAPIGCEFGIQTADNFDFDVAEKELWTLQGFSYDGIGGSNFEILSNTDVIIKNVNVYSAIDMEVIEFVALSETENSQKILSANDGNAYFYFVDLEVDGQSKVLYFSVGVETTPAFIPKVTMPMLSADDSIGVDVILDYVDDEKIVFHGYFGLFYLLSEYSYKKWSV